MALKKKTKKRIWIGVGIILIILIGMFIYGTFFVDSVLGGI